MGELKFELQGMPVSFEEFDEVVKYNIKMRDVPPPKEAIEAAKKILDNAPKPENGREMEIYNAGLKVGLIGAMADMELWWNLHQARIRQAAVSKRKEKFDPKHQRMAMRYDGLAAEDGDLPARKTIAEEEGMCLSSVNRVLKKMGRR